MEDEKLNDIIENLVDAKVIELSTWKKVRFTDGKNDIGRLAFEVLKIKQQIKEFDNFETSILFLEKLIRKSFNVQDNLRSSAPDITEEFKNEIKSILCNLQIQLLNTDKKIIGVNKNFINLERISEIKEIHSLEFDYKRLIKMLEEINCNYSEGNFLSVVLISRAIIDHIPPIFSLNNFNEVANNYGTKSFKKNMQHLNLSMRSISDSYLHTHIRKSESLPNENQIDFTQGIDLLLSEIIRIQKG